MCGRGEKKSKLFHKEKRRRKKAACMAAYRKADGKQAYYPVGPSRGGPPKGAALQPLLCYFWKL